MPVALRNGMMGPRVIRLGLFAAAIGAVALMPRAHSAQGEAEWPADLDPMQRIQCLLDAAQRRGDPAPCLTAEDPVRFQRVSLYAESANDEGA